jgi:hypothetical protein
MVEPADLRNGDDFATTHDDARLRCILRERQMRPGAVIVGKVTLQQTTQMPLAENYHMIQTFPTYRTDQSLGISVLPRTPGCGDYFSCQLSLYLRMELSCYLRMAEMRCDGKLKCR